MISHVNKHSDMRKAAIFVFLTMSVALAACAPLPGQGPLAVDISNTGAPDEHGDRYAVINLDAAVIRWLQTHHYKQLPDNFRTGLAHNVPAVLGVGDSLIVNIWEASPDGLFSTVEKKQTVLQTVVDESGTIFIPYVGRIKAAKQSVEELRKAIEDGLKGKAVEPQVQVQINESKSTTLTVVGDVAKAGQFPVPIRGLRLMDAVAQAGGTRKALFESVASIARGSGTATIRMGDIATNPVNNVWLGAGDSVTVTHQPRTFSAFGAVKTSQLVPFEAETLLLSEALAQVGGLSDRAADAGGVFIFRFEPRDLAKSVLGPNIKSLSQNDAGLVPVIYRLDFNQAGSFFLSQSFQMRDKDIIFVANHPTAELGKFLSMIVSPLLGAARTTVSLVD